ncbi:MAG TPA: TQO small subunit DoxD [Burkholderiales bacterium]|nr:TQO small subunit DoxD [Burkholderiales bacterium]
MTVVAINTAAPRAAAVTTLGERNWRMAAIALLSVRLIEGFIYWGGGSRRFIYGPEKLDPSAPTWMANKLQSAMPGALLGTDHLIAFLLHHFWLLYPAVILFSAAELIAGAALMAGLFTRLAALVSVGLSMALMLMFGWQGATCIDEWTMAACNLAMGATLVLAGGAAYSLDNMLLRRNPGLAGRAWFRWAAGSLPLRLTDRAFRNFGLAVLAAVLAFIIGTYSYYRGSVVTPFHGGPVSPTRHHFALSNGALLPDGSVKFQIYLDGGTPEAPADIMKAELTGGDNKLLETWNTETLTRLPAESIHNDFAYNKFKAGPYGIVAEMGAMATIWLPPQPNVHSPAGGNATLTLTDVNGRSFSLRLAGAGENS